MPGLGIEDFVVLEDGKPREVMLALDPVRYRLDVALVLDFSNSIRRDWSGEAAREAAHDFLDALGPDDCVYLVPFHYRVGPGVWGSPDSFEIRGTIGSYPFGAQTRLYDAMLTAHGALDQRRPDSASAAAEELDDMMGSMWMAPARGSACGEALSLEEAAERRAAMVVLTDGEDLGSRASYSDVLLASMRSEVPVFAVAVGLAAEAPRYRGASWGIVRSATPQQRALTRQAWENLRTLQDQLRELAPVSGGQVVVQKDLRHGYADTVGLLRDYYVLAYETPKPFEAGWHELEVEVPAANHQIVVQPGIYRSDEDYVAAVDSLRQASVEFELGDYEGALGQLDFVAQTTPDIGSPFFGRGLVLEQMERWQEARDSYTRSLQLRPGAPATHSRLAEVTFQLNDYAAAWEHGIRAHRGGVDMSELFARLRPVAPPPDDLEQVMVGPRVHADTTRARRSGRGQDDRSVVRMRRWGKEKQNGTNTLEGASSAALQDIRCWAESRVRRALHCGLLDSPRY